VNTVQDIEAAIRALSPEERERLAQNLPALLPEIDGDVAWERIIRDTRPRPAFSARVDQLEAEFQRDPTLFPELQNLALVLDWKSPRLRTAVS
jgi:hypothetical protein